MPRKPLDDRSDPHAIGSPGIDEGDPRRCLAASAGFGVEPQCKKGFHSLADYFRRNQLHGPRSAPDSSGFSL
jgi:hypothetical protein